MPIIEAEISLSSPDIYMALFGINEKNHSMLERGLGVKIKNNGGNIKIKGEELKVNYSCDFIKKISQIIIKNGNIGTSALRYGMELAKTNKLDSLEELLKEVITVTAQGRPIKCKTLKQREYIKSIKNNTLTIAVGPAGTGKTYLAMAAAVLALRNKEISKIVLTRPAVEAGEKLGFLPGDLNQKVDPYLRPLFDALFEFVGAETYHSLQERGVVEIAPLAYMRGRTLSDSFIILDEAQNTSPEQMKMFLTRIGTNSKVVVTGDITQTDLPYGKMSGLIHAIEVLKDVDDIKVIKLSNSDVVRNELVQKIVSAYEIYENKRARYAENRKLNNEQ